MARLPNQKQSDSEIFFEETEEDFGRVDWILPKEDLNLDPLTGEPGAHPVGSGLGAALGGAAAGAVAGLAGGPAGVIVGSIAGGVVGGLAGKATAEAIDPTMVDPLIDPASADTIEMDPLVSDEARAVMTNPIPRTDFDQPVRQGFPETFENPEDTRRTETYCSNNPSDQSHLNRGTCHDEEKRDVSHLKKRL